MANKTSLLLLAAGMGSRYGGLKQLDAFGPNGETLMEYSIYDAMRAGYDKIVFVIRRDFESDFKKRFISHIDNRVETHTVFQELEDIPPEFSVPTNRNKPWGTAHAVFTARNVIREPFAVLNADDFYGRESFILLHRFLTNINPADEPTYCIIGYPITQTLSDFGAVSRAVCVTEKENDLIKLVERPKVSRHAEGIGYEENGKITLISPDTIVSMNMMGFTPLFFEDLKSSFNTFLSESVNDTKAEHILPGVVNEVARDNRARVKVLPTTANWFGVTYKEDKQRVTEKVHNIVAAGIYPQRLWEQI